MFHSPRRPTTTMAEVRFTDNHSINDMHVPFTFKTGLDLTQNQVVIIPSYTCNFCCHIFKIALVSIAAISRIILSYDQYRVPRFQQLNFQPVSRVYRNFPSFIILSIILSQNLHLMYRASNVRTRSIECILFIGAI